MNDEGAAVNLHEKGAERFNAEYFRIGSGNVETAVVIRTTQQPLTPGHTGCRFEVMLCRQPEDIIGSQLIENLRQTIVFPFVPGAVEFKIPEKQQHFFKMIDGKLSVHGIQRMSDDVKYGVLREVTGQIVDAATDVLNFPMLGFGYIQSQDVKLAAVLRKIGGDLLADKRIRQVQNLKGAVDSIVIGDRHMRHSLGFCRMINA
jgi:hypothetical protein